MSDVSLTDDQWTKIRDFLLQDPNAYVGNEANCRRFVEEVKWLSRSGSQWRLLPGEYGNWNSVFKRFRRWCQNRVWERMLDHFADDPDMENGMIDSTIIRAHPCAAGAKKHGEQALGRSRGGFTTKIHVIVDGLGNPLRFRLTAGQRHDIAQAQYLLEGFDFERLIADRGYSAAHFIDYLLDRGIEAVIPPHQRANVLREYDRWLYRERHLVECLINKIKHFRRIFSRFDKLDSPYSGSLNFVGVLIWIR